MTAKNAGARPMRRGERRISVHRALTIIVFTDRTWFTTKDAKDTQTRRAQREGREESSIVMNRWEARIGVGIDWRQRRSPRSKRFFVSFVSFVSFAAFVLSFTASRLVDQAGLGGIYLA
jgi:hypothetical protein